MVSIESILARMNSNFGRRESIVVVFTPYGMTCSQRVQPYMWKYVRDFRESFFIIVFPSRFNEIDVVQFFTDISELVEDVTVV